MGQMIHWDLYGKLGYGRNERIVSHKQCINPLTSCCGTSNTDNKIEHNKPNIVVLDKIERTCLIIDVACRFDIQVKDQEKEKIENYQDLKQELKWIWKLRRVTVVPIIIGAFNCLERSKKLVSRDWCHMSFGIIAESVLTGYS